MKIRFNLGRGKNYRNWQLTNLNKVVAYFPQEADLTLYKTNLHNNKKTAIKIFNGANKQVCAWINCEDVSAVKYKSNVDFALEEIFYNPRECTSWVDAHGNNLDGMAFPVLVITGGKLFKVIPQL